MSLQERFHAKWIGEPMSGCWLWEWQTDRRGYGRINVEGKPKQAHRISWDLHYGQIPEGLIVCHHCDTPSCVNPDHLYTGTPADNSADMVRRGRQCRWNGKRAGEGNPRAKLTADQVEAIRRDPRLQRVIAEHYGIARSSVSMIKSKKRWAQP